MTKEESLIYFFSENKIPQNHCFLIYDEMPYTRDVDVCTIDRILYTNRRVIKNYTYERENYHSICS